MTTRKINQCLILFAILLIFSIASANVKAQIVIIDDLCKLNGKTDKHIPLCINEIIYGNDYLFPHYYRSCKETQYFGYPHFYWYKEKESSGSGR